MALTFKFMRLRCRSVADSTKPISASEASVRRARGYGTGARLALIGVAVNFLLALIKIIAGILGHCYALIADGIESTLDIFGSLAIWFGLKVAAEPPDERHPYGHGKAEPLASVAVALAVIAAAIGLAVQSIREIIIPHHAPAPFTLGVLVLVIVVKETLFRKVAGAAEQLGSGAVMTFGTGQWQLVPGADWRRPLGPRGARSHPKHPVTQVSWNDAAAYCAAQGKRLPSEIEYEYASRIGEPEGSAHAFGNDLLKDGRYRANVWTGVFPMLNTVKDGYATTSPVGAFGEGPLGLADMAGNVWEWTGDWYRPYAERTQPWPAGRVGEKVQRGGSFLCDPNVCYGFRVTARGHATPDSSHMHVGFRCARDVVRTAP